MWYKTKRKKTKSKNIQLVNLHETKEFLEATLSQRHKDYYGFVKTKLENKT